MNIRVERSATSINLSEIRNDINLQRQSIAAEKRQTITKESKMEIQGADKGGTEWIQIRREKNEKIRGNPCSNDKMDRRQLHSSPIHDSSERNNAGNKEPSSKKVKTNYDCELRDTRKDAHSSPSHDRETRSNVVDRNRQEKEIQQIHVEERLCAVQVHVAPKPSGKEMEKSYDYELRNKSKEAHPKKTACIAVEKSQSMRRKTHVSAIGAIEKHESMTVSYCAKEKIQELEMTRSFNTNKHKPRTPRCQSNYLADHGSVSSKNATKGNTSLPVMSALMNNYGNDGGEFNVNILLESDDTLERESADETSSTADGEDGDDTSSFSSQESSNEGSDIETESTVSEDQRLDLQPTPQSFVKRKLKDMSTTVTHL